jgi:hypothetical protein
LINYQRCPRQYYFDRILHAPTPDVLTVWNDAEVPEPPANLTATLKGAVIHRFCETYTAADKAEERLRLSFAEVVRSRQAELADRLLEIDTEAAIAELLPLAQNYLASSLFERVETARAARSRRPPAYAGGSDMRSSLGPRGEAGLWSELSFRLRRPLGILSGAIDKLIITPAADKGRFEVEIIDFKTNRFARRGSGVAGLTSGSPGTRASHRQIDEATSILNPDKEMEMRRPRSQHKLEQIAFDFSAPAIQPRQATLAETSIDDLLRTAALDYQLQMQAYALAVRELWPGQSENVMVKCTLHFLQPNVEFQLTNDLLEPAACAGAIDEAMLRIISSSEPRDFPVHTALHCRMCNFLSICFAGREYVRALRQTGHRQIGLGAAEAGR